MMNKRQSSTALAAFNAGIVPSAKPDGPKPITKQDITNFILGSFTFVSIRYSGNDNTFYIRGVQAKDAELAVLKAFPKMPFKTQSNTEPPTRDAKDYFFQKDGTMLTNAAASNIVFGCKARTARNAKRKYGNYIAALTTGTGVKWQAPESI